MQGSDTMGWRKIAKIADLVLLQNTPEAKN
jgi:hypothetical protein